MTQNGSLDTVDLKILDILQQDARTEAVQIARRVHKTPAAVGDRIRKLKEKGFIRQYTAVLDRGMLGRPTMMVAMVRLHTHGASALMDFPGYIRALPEVQVCLQLSGEYDFLLHVVLRDAFEYKLFLETKLCCLAIVDRVQSSLVLEECKMELALQLERPVT